MCWVSIILAGHCTHNRFGDREFQDPQVSLLVTAQGRTFPGSVNKGNFRNWFTQTHANWSVVEFRHSPLAQGSSSVVEDMFCTQVYLQSLTSLAKGCPGGGGRGLLWKTYPVKLLLVLIKYQAASFVEASFACGKRFLLLLLIITCSSWPSSEDLRWHRWYLPTPLYHQINPTR